MNISNCHRLKVCFNPIAAALALAVSGAATLATANERYEGYVPKQQQEAAALEIGSGYTRELVPQDTSAVSAESVSAMAPRDGRHYWRSEYIVAAPLAIQGAEPSVTDDAPYQAGSGYTSLDRNAVVVVVIADNASIDADQSEAGSEMSSTAPD